MRIHAIRFVAGIACVLWASLAHAVTLQFTLEELVQKLREAQSAGNPASQALAEKLQSYFTENNIQIVGNGFLIQKPVDYAAELWHSCDEKPAYGLQLPDPWAAGIQSGFFSGYVSAPQSALKITVNGKKVSATFSLSGRVTGESTVFVIWAWKYWDQFKFDWKCAYKKKDKVDAQIDALVAANATLSMDILNLTASGNTITIQNNFQLSGKVDLPNYYSSGIVNPKLTIGSGFVFEDNVTEQLFRDLVHGLEFNKQIYLALKRSLIDTAIQGAYDDWLLEQQLLLSQMYGTFTFEVQLPPLDDERIIAEVQNFLATRYGYRDHPELVNALYAFIKSHLVEIVFALLTDDQDGLDQLMLGAGCEAIKSFETSLPASLYHVAWNGWRYACVAADPFGAEAGEYYSDAGCDNEVVFKPSVRAEYCKTLFSRLPNTVLGNAALHEEGDPGQVDSNANQPWTASYGNRLNVMAESNVGTTQPMMKRQKYKSVRSKSAQLRGLNECDLEMRIYKKDIAAQNLQPLLMIHGGSWQYRSPFYATEASISQYTDAGFIVFAPFYRLAGDADGSAECNQATWEEIVSDIESALVWIEYNGVTYGADEARPAVVGQSAGAHLAAWLVTHRPLEISRALLLYPPTDVLDFLRHRFDIYAAYNDAAHLDPLSKFFGTDVSQIDVNNPPSYILQNSFTGLVHSWTPPVFILHGIADNVIPSNQAVILCNAYGINAVNYGGGANLRATYSCGRSSLHLFELGQHGLDACIRGQSGAAQATLCLSGSDASADLVADSLRTARQWLRATR